jgi:Ca2+-binding EF-hand superfamily protein
MKELTDEQINWFAKAYTDRNGKLNIVDFVRAILRKAQEK